MGDEEWLGIYVEEFWFWFSWREDDYKNSNGIGIAEHEATKATLLHDWEDNFRHDVKSCQHES